MLRVVLDVNVLISALYFPGTCRKIVASLEENRFEPVLSPVLIEDLLRTMEKPKLKRLIEPPIFDEIITLIHMKALITEPKLKVKACRDPTDDAVLECALSSGAHFVVTGDQDLLVLKKFRRISIIQPNQFAKQLRLI